MCVDLELALDGCSSDTSACFEERNVRSDTAAAVTAAAAAAAACYCSYWS